MTLGGWCFLVISWSLIASMLVFCSCKLFGEQDETNDPGRDS